VEERTRELAALNKALEKENLDRAAAEEQLGKAHREVEQLLASMSSFLIGVGRDLRVNRWNAAAAIAFNLPPEQVIGKRCEEAGFPWDWNFIVKHVPEMPEVSKSVRLPELPYRRSDGTEGYLGFSLNPVRDEQGALNGFFLLGTDITERRNLEVQLIQAQKLESIGQLAAGIAHEINTPTQYVGDNLEFLRDAFANYRQLMGKYLELLAAAKQGAVSPHLAAEIESLAEELDLAYLTEQIPRAIEQSLEGVSRVAKIVQAMKEFSHPEIGEKTPTDINRAIESTITVARNEWKYVAEMITDFDAGLPLVPCLAGEFNQVILNIIINAAHAIADAARDSQMKGAITISTRLDGDWVEIRIQDTGTGIPEHARNRVFDPFFTTKEVGKGTGQGLAIARNVIVEKHGGTLTFETEPGRGTTFIIHLPIQETT
ncbi:MAG TPA: PAS domain-containing protein, partial [Candidatus Hydrogenedentes bacterium]|nr:PAS domain-containing protein [Candidatus Hydrogenedentota bacterium]